MEFSIKYQESYSRSELLLRSFFGWLYILAPHLIVMMILGIWSNIISFIAWWSILFTGRYPQSFFEYNVKMINWGMRFNASMYNLIDGYPAIGPNGSHPSVTLNVPYPEQLSKGKLLLRTFFGGIYIQIPHMICLCGRFLVTGILQFLAWFSVLFTGKYPQNWFEFNVGTLRWILRLNLHLMNMTDVYPPFSGKPNPE
ncbi:MAG: DUF4389 domain-containing protein [Deltaproteobacteria bacterium]|nr:DUF4389 domain-containing protein [Deltaproteobacteria bacterium]